MTHSGPKGNTEFCFPETLNVSEAKPREIHVLRPKGKQNSLFPAEPVIINKCFQNWKNCEEIVCFMSAGSQICHTVSRFKEQDLIMW